MEKEFDLWNDKKKSTEQVTKPLRFYEREVWWCIMGVNVGVEIDGKHELFLRPVIVARKFNSEMLLIVPSTTQDKENKYYSKVSGDDEKTYTACLSQLRTISSKRLLRKIGTIREEEYAYLIEKLSRMICGTL